MYLCIDYFGMFWADTRSKSHGARWRVSPLSSTCVPVSAQMVVGGVFNIYGDHRWCSRVYPRDGGFEVQDFPPFPPPETNSSAAWRPHALQSDRSFACRRRKGGSNPRVRPFPLTPRTPEPPRTQVAIIHICWSTKMYQALPLNASRQTPSPL